MTTFSDFCFLNEAISQVHDDVKTDNFLRTMMQTRYPHFNDVSVVHAGSMDDHGLRVLSFHNPETGMYEVHLHNNNQMPGTKVDVLNHRATLTAIKLMHSVAKRHIDAGYRVQFQVGPSGDNYDKYHSLAKRLASHIGYRVAEVGLTPISSMPQWQGKSFVVDRDN